MMMLILLCVGFAIFGAALFLESRRRVGGGQEQQIADLLKRVDELEQSAVSVSNELRRLEDSQRFTERLLTSRSGPAPLANPESPARVPDNP